MEVINDRLITIMRQLRNTDLVTRKEVSEGSLAEFRRILNKVEPIGDYDRLIGDYTKYFYNRNRAAFCKYLDIINAYHLILLTEGGDSIASILGVSDIIDIYWSRQQHEFIVTDRSSIAPQPTRARHSKNHESNRLPKHQSSRPNRNGGRANNSDRPAVKTPVMLPTIPQLTPEQCAIILASEKQESAKNEKSYADIAKGSAKLAETDDSTPIVSKSWTDMSDDE